MTKTNSPAKKSQVPTLTSQTTAYALLSAICKAITEEPRRYNQGTWFTSPNSLERWYPPERQPACGTIGCVAGWVGVLVRSRESLIRMTAKDELGENIQRLAQVTLGLSFAQASELFDADAVELVTSYSDTPEIGTAEYAAAGVKHIRAFQKRHAKQLKAKIVTPYALRKKKAEGEARHG